MRALTSGDALPSATPIAADEFAGLVKSFAPFSTRCAIAVSGGPDSMALAFCVKRWGGDILALIVDHALRPESAKETEETQKKLIKLGIQSEILRWDHEPVVSKLHATARKARYSLLVEACRRHGIHDLLLAHQREDQAETILMRLAKGSGVDGLAGIPARSFLSDVRLVRPFLNIAKERLIATCAAAGISFIADPSNDSEKFARGRLRRVLPLLADEGLTVKRLLDLGARAGEVRDALDHYTKSLLRVATKRDDAGVLRFNLEQLRSAPRAVGLRALGFCLQHVHEEEYGPERASLASLYDALCAGGDMETRTLHGCLIAKNENHATFMREYAAVTDAPTIRTGETVVWDNRWAVTLAKRLEINDQRFSNLSSSSVFSIRPLGNPPHEFVDKLMPSLRHQFSQGRIRACLPSLWQGEKLVLIPSFMDLSPIAEARLFKPWPPCGF